MISSESGILSQYLEDKRNALAARYLSGSRILDVGCNEGSLRKFFKNVEYVGIDMHPPKGETFSYFQQDALGDLSQLGMFDGIACLAMIEHVHEYEKLLPNLKTILKPKGRVFLTTPSKIGDAIHHHTANVGIVSSEAAEDHDHIFTLKELEQLVKDAGMKVHKKGTFLWGLNQYIVAEKNE